MMINDEWYRNHSWNKDIEKFFFDKLKRARDKEQYLRIQASYLSGIEPHVSLKLLDMYFNLKDDFEHAQAYHTKATALINLGDFEGAVSSFKSALQREFEFPNLKTDAYIDYPLFIIRSKLYKYYKDAYEVLNINEDRLMFPVDKFRWYAVKAIIDDHFGNNEISKDFATIALVTAKIDKSGFEHHKHLGLVDNKYEDIIKQLISIAA